MEKKMKPQRHLIAAACLLVVTGIVAAILATPAYMRAEFSSRPNMDNSPPTTSPDHYTLHRSFETTIGFPSEVNLSSVIAVDDNYTVHTYARIGSFSSNDTGPNGPGFDSYRAVTLPTHGTISPVTSDTPWYYPQAGFTGIDSFIYEICEAGECDMATVTITVVNQRPVALDDRYTATPPYRVFCKCCVRQNHQAAIL
jgi:hypothetical protein